jgi:hypothetical protein
MLVKETGVSRENHRPQVIDKLYHIMAIPAEGILVLNLNK